MANMPNPMPPPGPNNQAPIFPQRPQPTRAQALAARIADLVRAGAVIAFWSVVAAAVGGAALICFKIILWAIRRAEITLGL